MCALHARCLAGAERGTLWRKSTSQDECVLRGWLNPGSHMSLCKGYNLPEDVCAPPGCEEERDPSCFAAGTRTGAVAVRTAATAQAAAAGLEAAIPGEISSANGAGEKW